LTNTPFTLRGPKTPKRYFAGTHRAVEPAETWARIEPLLPRFGITRIADITGLDRIGIPVATAVRPLSRSVSVSAGKGATLIAAKVSAAMEAIECAHAETIDRPLVFASRAELAPERRAVDLATLPRTEGHGLGDASRLLWIEGRELADASPVMVPYELVHAHYCPPALPHAGAFLATTNGLASGNSMAEAVAHGLFEVIERDALTAWSRRPASERDQWLLDLDVEAAGDGFLAETVLRLRRAGMLFAVWDITSDIAVPAFHCILVDGADPHGQAGTGSGCHPDKAVALSRALLEAVQVRAIYISGGRDDLFRPDYEAAHLRSFRSALGATTGRKAARRPFSALPSRSGKHFEDDLRQVHKRLASAGCPSVILVDLSRSGSGISVVRVVVPGLEGPLSQRAEPVRRVRQAAP
jgi:ribosomal protein S12 methylthiotransferase accessory factor